MSFKVDVLAYGETKYVSNGLRFKTAEEAETYAQDLACRWTMVDKWVIVRTPDEPNR